MITIEPGQNGTPPHRTHAFLMGGTVYLKLPPAFLNHINLTKLKEEDGPDKIPILLQEERGDYGDYGSFWNPQQQNE